jgi:ParB-like chromosome segregation protein Spo0J
VEIKMVAVGALKHSEYNPRRLTKEQFDQIKTSIEKYGFVENIVVNSAPGREGVIIGGNQRFEVAKKLGHKEVPVFYKNIPDLKKEQDLSLRLNRNIGSWDWDSLANLDKEILLDAGFTPDELAFGFDVTPLDTGGDKSETNIVNKKFAVCPECAFEFEIQTKKIKKNAK